MRWIRSWIATIGILINRPLMKRLKEARAEFDRGETISWESEIDDTICPNCKSEETTTYDTELSRTMRLCESCNAFYECNYKTECYEVKFLKFRGSEKE